MNELATQRLIIDWLNANGHAVWLNEIPVGMPSRYSRTGRRRAANRRTPDIVGVIKGGRGLFIEVKKPAYEQKIAILMMGLMKGDYSVLRKFNLGNAKETERAKEQAETIMWLRKRGACAFFAFSLEQVQCVVGNYGVAQG